MAGVFGYLPLTKLVVAWTRYRARGQRQFNDTKATQTAWSIIAVPLGMAAWAWLLAVLVYIVIELSGADDNAWYLDAALICTAAGWWVLVSLVGCGILAVRDRPRLLAGGQFGLWAVAVIVSIGGPAVAGWGLLHLFS